MASKARCRPAVAELIATPWASAPRNSTNSFSKAAAFGPVVNHPERMVSTTASISASVMSGRANGRKAMDGSLHARPRSRLLVFVNDGTG